eukprot:Skav230517  [mRNA]  locus=scaffold4943:90077:94678:+ [translate_table: standard]
MGGTCFLHLFLPAALLSVAVANPAPATSSPLNWTGDVLHRSIEAVSHQPHYDNLRQEVDAYLADALGGTQGEALISFTLAALLLLRGGWLLTDCRWHRVPWFLLGFAMSFGWLVYGVENSAAQLQLAASISCHTGMLLALFPQAGCYIVGAAATSLAIRLVHASRGLGTQSLVRLVPSARSASHVMDDEAVWAAWICVAGILGGYLCSRFQKPALDFIFALTGSAAMALMIHWWLNEAFHWCMRRPEPIGGSGPLHYWLALWSNGGPWDSFCRWCFSLSWLLVFWLGLRLRRRLEVSDAERLHRKMQDQLRKAPSDCDRMPWGRPNGAGPPGGPLLPVRQEDDLRPSAPEEEDFGMRSKSVSCFSPAPRPKIVPLRQSTSLPTPATEPRKPSRRVTLAGRPSAVSSASP